MATLKACFRRQRRIVETEKGENAAKNARIHIATYQTLGLDNDEADFASFLTDHYPEMLLQPTSSSTSATAPPGASGPRCSNAIPTPSRSASPPHRVQLRRSQKKTEADAEDHRQQPQLLRRAGLRIHLIQAQEDGYLAACEIIKRKAYHRCSVFTKAEVLAAKPTNTKTGQPISEEELTKDQYTGQGL